MKIVLLDVTPKGRYHVYKDLAAGFGTKLIVGNSLRARLIEWAKKRFMRLPLVSFGYLAAIFRQSGHEVEYVRNQLERAAKADLVLTTTSLVDYSNELYSIQRLKQLGCTAVGLFGPVASLFPDTYLEAGADFVLVGEPEAGAIHLADNGLSLKGKIVSPPLKNLSELPFPSWDGFPVKTYSYYPALKKSPVLPVLGSRGCFAPCEYCAYRTNYKWRMRDPEHVVAELAELKKRHKIRSVIFRDPMFTGNNNRAEKIAELLIGKNIGIEWACETALEFLNEKLLNLLHRAGLRAINVGIESGNDDVLISVQRRAVAQRASEHLINYCNKIGIRVSAFYCLGLPEDTEETIKNTMNYAKRLNTHVATFNVFTPYPGTPLYEKVKHEIFDHHWDHYTSFTPVHRHPLLSPEKLAKLREQAFLSFYFRPQYFLSFLQRMLN